MYACMAMGLRACDGVRKQRAHGKLLARCAHAILHSCTCCQAAYTLCIVAAHGQMHGKACKTPGDVSLHALGGCGSNHYKPDFMCLTPFVTLV